MQEIDSFDDHYSPTKPDEYIRLRLLKALRFYRKRLPTYAKKKEFSQWTIMLGTATGALIAFIGFAPQVAIISSERAAWVGGGAGDDAKKEGDGEGGEEGAKKKS